jgi:hypothetical protein
MAPLAHTPSSPPSSEPEWLHLVREHVEKLRYGVVQLVVHDGRVMQIELTEKVRLPAKGVPGQGA